jgi:endo-1,4-beta-mannosidase
MRLQLFGIKRIANLNIKIIKIKDYNTLIDYTREIKAKGILIITIDQYYIFQKILSKKNVRRYLLCHVSKSDSRIKISI